MSVNTIISTVTGSYFPISVTELSYLVKIL